MHGGTPVGMLGQDDRQLDHLSGFHLRSRSAEQYIAPVFRVGVRSGGKFHNARWPQCRKHIERKVGSRLVRLVHNHQRTVKSHKVHKGELDCAVLATFKPCRVFGDMGKVRFKLFRMGISLPSVGIARS
ncbi:MAG: hypothetical protein WCK32_03590 [Chlorobiaceae bacterium]